MRTQFIFDTKDLKARLDTKAKNVNAASTDIVKEIAEKIYIEIKVTHPIKTGKTVRNIKKDLGKLLSEIYTNDPVSKFLEGGTQGHFIQPKKAGKVLAWQQGGQAMFSKGHYVKGIRSTGTFENAYNKIIKGYMVDKIVTNNLKKI